MFQFYCIINVDVYAPEDIEANLMHLPGDIYYFKYSRIFVEVYLYNHYI